MRRARGEPAPLGDLQLAVMQILWQQQKATLAEIKAQLERERPIATTTIATVLSRLERSGVVSHREGDRPRTYVAARTEGEMQAVQARRLVDGLFAGRAADLIAHLVRHSRIDGEELARLKKLIQERTKS